VVDLETADDQRNSGLEGVRVKAETDAQRHSAYRKSEMAWVPLPPPLFAQNLPSKDFRGGPNVFLAQKLTPGPSRAGECSP
jgi:hypothetical protein